jgi:hypothetical protein
MRSRNLKPGFFVNAQLGELPPTARLLFQGLWCLADREGRLLDRPKQLRAEILPYDEVDADAFLDMLAAGPDPFILRYSVDGNRYIQVINFSRHQHPHKTEAASRIPAPSSGSNGKARHKRGPAPVQALTDNGAIPVQVPLDNGAIPVQSPLDNATNPADSLVLIPDSLVLIPSFSPAPALDAPDPSPLAPKKGKTRGFYGSRENVKLTPNQYNSLIDTIGKDETERWIETFSVGLAKHPEYRYPSHYSGILDWRHKEAEAKAEAKAAGVNFTQPEHDDEYYNGLYEKILPAGEAEKGTIQ